MCEIIYSNQCLSLLILAIGYFVVAFLVGTILERVFHLDKHVLASQGQMLALLLIQILGTLAWGWAIYTLLGCH